MIYTTAGYANAGVAYSFFRYKLCMNHRLIFFWWVWFIQLIKLSLLMFSVGKLFKSKTHSFIFLYLTLTTVTACILFFFYCVYYHLLLPAINNICFISAKAVIHELLIVLNNIIWYRNNEKQVRLIVFLPFHHLYLRNRTQLFPCSLS